MSLNRGENTKCVKEPPIFWCCSILKQPSYFGLNHLLVTTNNTIRCRDIPLLLKEFWVSPCRLFTVFLLTWKVIRSFPCHEWTEKVWGGATTTTTTTQPSSGKCGYPWRSTLNLYHHVPTIYIICVYAVYIYIYMGYWKGILWGRFREQTASLPKVPTLSIWNHHYHHHHHHHNHHHHHHHHNNNNNNNNNNNLGLTLGMGEVVEVGSKTPNLKVGSIPRPFYNPWRIHKTFVYLLTNFP